MLMFNYTAPQRRWLMWPSSFNQAWHWHCQSANSCHGLQDSVLEAVHKVRHTRRGGGPRRSEKVWQCVTEGGSKEHVTSHLPIFYHTYETWNLKWCLTFWCNRCILTERERTKTTPDKIFQTKDPLTKAPEKTLANNWNIICTRGLCPGFVY